MRHQGIEQRLLFKRIALARNQKRALHRLVSDDNRHTPPVFQLLFQHIRHKVYRAADVNRIKRRTRRRFGQPVVLHIIDIVQTQTVQHRFGAVLLFRIDIVRNHPARQLRQQRGSIARSRADFQNRIVFRQLQALRQPRHDFRLEHLMPVGKRQLRIRIRQTLQRRIHETLARNLLQSVQHIKIQYIPRTDLLFDHIEPRFFKIHLMLRQIIVSTMAGIIKPHSRRANFGTRRPPVFSVSSRLTRSLKPLLQHLRQFAQIQSIRLIKLRRMFAVYVQHADTAAV